MNKRIAEIIGSLVGIVLFSAALWVLHHEFRQLHYHEVVAQFRALPFYRVALAIVVTAMSYLALSGYDMLALSYIKHRLEYPKVLLTSFITYALAHNLGFSLFTGGSVRLRLYSAWGLSTFEITSLMGFGIVTFWLGYLSLGALTFITVPLSVPENIHVPFGSALPLGILFLGLILAYLTWIVVLRRPLRIRGWQFEVPSTSLTVSQMGIGVFDWLMASTALFILLPPIEGLAWGHVVGAYLLSQIAGLASNVPGGLGVFETVFILLIGTVAEPAAIVGSLLAYRLIYYLLPLAIAAISLASYELTRRREGLKRIAAGVGRWVPMFVPQILSFTTFVAGVVLLFSGATPAVKSRMLYLDRFLPMPVIEISHFVGSILGLGLLLLARGLQRRVDAAYILSVTLLLGGIMVSLLKGFDYEEAFILSIMLLALLPSRSYFYRKSSLLGRSLSPGWIAAIAVVLVSTVWLIIFSFKHVAYTSEYWWQFSIIHGDAPRSLRAGAGVVVAALVFAVWRLMQPAAPEPDLPDSSELDGVMPIIAQSPNSLAYLALLGDKELLHSPSGRSFIMYGIAGRSWVSLGDPVGPQTEWKELVWQFHEISDRHGGWTVFYQVGADVLPLYLDLGLSPLKLGEEARIDLSTFSLEGHANKQMRHWHRKPESEGCTFQVVPQSRVPEILPRLRDISDTWLTIKNTREKRYSLGYFNEEYLKRLPLAVVHRNGELIAFANIWASSNMEELSIDLMRHVESAPTGVMDYLFIELMLWGKQQGYRWFNMGMAPLSGLESRAAAPFWNQLGTFVFRHGEHFYNFQGLRKYKEKFHPVWEPKFLVSPGGVAVFGVLTNIASMISGGITGVVKK